MLVESSGSWPPRSSSSSAASATVVAERPDLVEAARERDQAVARDAPVRGLDADDAAERRGLPDRATGVGAERERREPGRDRRRPILRSSPPARGRCRAGCGSGRTPSSRWTSPSRTRRGWSSPTTMPPAAAMRSTTVAVYGRRQPSRIRDPHVVGTPRVHMLSFTTTGTPASGPGSSPPATAASTASAAARAASAEHES